MEFLVSIVPLVADAVYQDKESSSFGDHLIETKDDHNSSSYSTVTLLFSFVALVWYFVVTSLAILGTVIIGRRHSRTGNIKTLPDTRFPGVTILRPLKGIDTEAESCLSSAFEQDYPDFEILFCVESEGDAIVGLVQKLIARYPQVEAQLLIGSDHYGPNPKINNLAKGFVRAQHDIIWVLDSNVWVSPGTLARSVQEFLKSPRIKLVHHLPMCISVNSRWERNWGAKLDEMFILTAHAKFYSAINAVALAPCVTGKSNLYRRSDLDCAVQAQEPGHGIRVFAQYIAEDNMIAEALWKAGGRTAMTSDSAIQPLANVSYGGYLNRRVRWLRVRRYMVPAATMLEPTTESIVCGIIGSFGFSVWIFRSSNLFSWLFYLLHMICWCLIDYWQFNNLLRFRHVEHTTKTPFFVSPLYSPDASASNPPSRRKFVTSWFPVWAARELLAFPIWLKAMCGHQIQWRNRPFRIKKNLTAEEIIQ